MRLNVPRSASLLGWVILLPALLLALGLWEASRAARSVEIYTMVKRELPAKVAELRELAAREPMASIDLGNGLLSAELAASKLADYLPAAGRDLLLARAQVPLGWAVAIGGALALLIGAAGLLAAKVAAGSAMRSRDALIASFAWLHRALPIMLIAMIVGLTMAIVAASVFEIISLWFVTALSGNSIKLMAIGLMLAAGAAYAAFAAVRGMRDVFALYTPQPADMKGHVVAEEDAPELWRFVRDLSQRQGTVAPDAVVVGLEQGFFVTEQDLRLWPGERLVSGRTLYLPAPYLELLDQNEIEAIIGHELAHFSGEDTRYSQRFAPLYAGMQRALGALEVTGSSVILLYGPLRMAGNAMVTFDESVQHWSRLREFEADRLACVVAAPASAASALIRTAVIAPRVDAVLDKAFRHPGESANLVADTVKLVAQDGWPDVSGHLDDVQSHPTDTHPSTPDRIRKLGIPLDDALLATALRPIAHGASFGRRLIADWDGLCRRISGDFLDDARAAHEEHRLFLQAAVAAVPQEDVVLYEDVALMAHVQTSLAVLSGLCALSVLAMRRPLGLTHDGIAFAIILGFCLTGLAWAGTLAVLTRQRRHVPLLTLTPDLFHAPRLSRRVAWRDIDGWGVVTGKGVVLQLILKEGVALPGVTRASKFIKVKPKKRLVQIGGFGVKGMKVPDFANLIGRYIQAEEARRVLAERQG